jgi:hypothetical protein
MTVAFVVQMLAGGCTAPADQPEEVTRVDSAGVEIVVSPAEGIGLPWVLEAEPSVVIGEGTNDPNYQFQTPFPAARDESGRIVVTDAFPRRVAIYDSGGSFIRDVGRAGEGPGEYNSFPQQVFSSGDTLFVAEVNQRVSAFTVDGTFLESWQPWQPNEQAWGRILPEGRVRALGVVAGALARFADGSFVLDGTASIDPGRQGIQFAQVPFGRWRPREQRIDPIGTYPGSAAVAVNSQGGVRASRPHLSVPHGPFFGAFDETLIVTNGLAFEIASYNANGGLFRKSRVARTASAVTDRMREDMRDAIRNDDPHDERVSAGAALSRFDETPFLDSLPFFQGIVVTSEGYVWAAEYVLSDDQPGFERARTYHVFAPDGAYLGAQELPDRFSLWSAGPTWILGTHTDELDVQSVRLYRLGPRPGS